jgi:hypothetical protein
MTMSQFIYLYRGGEAGRSPEKMQHMQQKWTAWLKELTEQGHIVMRIRVEEQFLTRELEG